MLHFRLFVAATGLANISSFRPPLLFVVAFVVHSEVLDVHCSDLSFLSERVFAVGCCVDCLGVQTNGAWLCFCCSSLSLFSAFLKRIALAFLASDSNGP